MVLFACLSFIILTLYFDYITGNKIIIYPHISSDVINQFLPRDTNIASSFEETGKLITISSKAGWGGIIGSHNPFEIIKVIFGADNVVYAYLFSLLTKIILSSIFMYCYLCNINVDNFAAVIGALGYAFSTQVIAGSSWASQGEIAVLLAMALLSCEYILRAKNFFFIILTIGMWHMTLPEYHIVVYGVCIIFYLCLRGFQIHGKRLLRKKIIIAIAVSLCGFGILLLVKIAPYLGTYRVIGNLKQLDDIFQKAFSNANLKSIAISLLRTFSPNCFGIPGLEKCSLPDGYLSDGGFYSGILLTLCFPQLLVRNKDKKTVYLVLLASIAYICFPVFRLFFNGLSNDTYKLGRMAMTAVVVVVSSIELSEMLYGSINYRVLRTTVCFMLCVILVAVKYVLYPGRLIFAAVFIVLYWILLSNNERINEKYLKIGLIICFIIDLIGTQYIWMNNHDAITTEEYTTGYYNDGTADIVKKLPMDFYRIAKDYQSVYLSDGEIQNYNGVSYYKGGMVDGAIYDYIVTRSLPSAGNNVGWFKGMQGSPRDEAIFSVQYYLSKHQSCYEYGYKEIDKFDDITVYQSDMALNFGATYQKMIKKTDYLKLDLSERKDILAEYCVVDDNVNIPLKEYADNRTNTVEGREEIEFGKEIPEKVNLKNINASETVVLNFYSQNEVGIGIAVFDSAANQYTEIGEVSLYAEGNGEAQFEISNFEGDMYLYLKCSVGGLQDIEHLKVTVYDSDGYYGNFYNNIQQRNQNRFEMNTCNDYSGYRGVINVEEESLFYIPLVYDVNYSKYKVFVDGMEQQVLAVNGIFGGVIVSPGKHDIQVVYEVGTGKLRVTILGYIVGIMLLFIMERLIKRRRLI